MNEGKTAIYSRVAQADEERLNWQEEKLLHFTEQNGYGDCACYRDNGISGMSLDRPGMIILMNDIRDGSIRTVIVNSLDRIARSYTIMERWFIFLAKYGIILLSVNEDYRFPDDGSLFMMQTVS